MLDPGDRFLVREETLSLRPPRRLLAARADWSPQPRPLGCAGGVFDLEYTALKMLTEAERKQRERGVLLWLVGLTPAVLAMAQHSPLGAALGRERMFFNLEQAVAKHQAAATR